MLRKFYFICMLMFFSCEDSSSNSMLNPEQSETINKNTINGSWNLIHLSGGVVGANKTYSEGEIIWRFKGNGTLIVEKSITSDSFSLGSGTYNYVILKKDSKYYLNINSNRSVGIRLLNNKMTINENELPSGGGADGFILKLEK